MRAFRPRRAAAQPQQRRGWRLEQLTCAAAVEAVPLQPAARWHAGRAPCDRCVQVRLLQRGRPLGTIRSLQACDALRVRAVAP
jgi:hypothetical protein